MAPHITTDRLLLRELRLGDFAEYFAALGDLEHGKFIAVPGIDSRAAFRMFTSAAGQWVITNSGWWAIERRDTGAFAGTVGAFFRETQLEDRTSFELGWTVNRAHARQGFAAEAAAAARDYGFATFPSKRAIAYVDEKNIASIGVAKKIGMAFDGNTTFYGEPSQLYTLAR